MKLEPVKHVKTRKGQGVDELVREMEGSGVMACGELGRAVSVLEKMVRDKKSINFFGVAGAMVPGGMRDIIREFLEKKWFQVFVCTGATLTHDLVEALGYRHYKGSEKANDAELNKKGLDRIWNAYMPNSAYTKLERFVKKASKGTATRIGGTEYLKALGGKAPEKSLLGVCFKKNIPVFVPGLGNSGLGIMSHYALKEQGKTIDALKDLDEIFEIAWTAERKGVFYVCGGESKNFIQQAMQFAPKPANYAVQITNSTPFEGGSSGAELREGISWGKLGKKALYANVYADATICLPIISSALKQRLKR